MLEQSAFLKAVREDRADLARVLRKHKGIRRTVEDLYPDSAHFIYELLQNAEDVGATQAGFLLEDNCLYFEHHNGRHFSEVDVWAITDIGEGTKAEDREKIGRFGIGFKAVFAYSETPLIYSGNFAFRIEDLVLPFPVPHRDEFSGGMTRFEFPFNSRKKPVQKAFAEIKTCLEQLSLKSLLFLNNIEAITWGVGGKEFSIARMNHSDNHVEIIKANKGSIEESSHFLRFTSPVPGLKKQVAAIAFDMALRKGMSAYEPDKAIHSQLEIVSATPGVVAVSFPAEKETSGLRFHIHAPFVPELSRASVKDTALNDPLYDLLADLSAKSLFAIRDQNLLGAGFLGVLPNSLDTLPPRYAKIRSRVHETMSSEHLTPVHGGGHLPATDLLQSKPGLKNLLGQNDLAFLLGTSPNAVCSWAVNTSRRNRFQDQFIADLKIANWGVTELIGCLELKEYEDGYSEWLASQTDDWMQSLYSFLFSELEPEDRLGEARYLHIVRLDSGDHIPGNSNCYFPGTAESSLCDKLHRVLQTVYSSGSNKKQQENARKFLEAIGVREVGEAEEITAILRKRYQRSGIQPLKKDLKRFVEFVEKNPQKAEIFSSYSIFEDHDGNWRTPAHFYLDLNSHKTGLSAYYDNLGEEADRFPMANWYADSGLSVKRLVKFATDVGVRTELKVDEVRCASNPQYAYLISVPGERYTNCIDRDFTIKGLARVLSHPTIELSRLIWNRMCTLPPRPNYLKAQYQKNAANGSRTAESQLVHILRESNWVPQTGGEFVRPLDASRELLPEGFPFDSGYRWLAAIEFGKGKEKRLQLQLQKRKLLLEAGIDPKEYDLFQKYRDDIELLKKNPDAWEQFKSEINEISDRSSQLGSADTSRSDRRRAKIKERMLIAPKRTSSKQMRSAADYKKDEVDNETLRTFYRDENDRVFCQMCLRTMPFLNRDSTVHSQRMSIFTKPWAEKRGFTLRVITPLNFLFCPTCAALYGEYVHHDFELQDDLLNQLRGELNELVVQCTRRNPEEKNRTVLLHHVHHTDIQTCIEEFRSNVNF